MSQIIVVGLQWGNDGKGKIVNLLADFADIVVRYQGSGSAGHTVMVEGEKIVLNTIPSGILHQDVISIIANGMVIDLDTLVGEIEMLQEKGIEVTPDTFRIASNVHLILPYHKLLDQYRKGSAGFVSGAASGINSAYEDKVARRGIRLEDFLDKSRFMTLIKENLNYYNTLFEHLYQKDSLVADEIVETYEPYRELLESFSINAPYFLNNQISKGQTILFEGSEGALNDLDLGTYPHVSPTNTTAGGAITGSGIGLNQAPSVLGIFKAYTSLAGDGVFPTELNDDTGIRLRNEGFEFSAITGEPRRVGWIDLVALRHAIGVNGVTSLAITKLDVLNNFDEIKICTAYHYQGERLTNFIDNMKILQYVTCEYETYEGWQEALSDVRMFEDLPSNAQRYILALETHLQVPVDIVSVGPQRHKTILRRNPFRK